MATPRLPIDRAASLAGRAGRGALRGVPSRLPVTAAPRARSGVVLRRILVPIAPHQEKPHDQEPDGESPCEKGAQELPDGVRVHRCYFTQPLPWQRGQGMGPCEVSQTQLGSPPQWGQIRKPSGGVTVRLICCRGFFLPRTSETTPATTAPRISKGTKARMASSTR